MALTKKQVRQRWTDSLFHQEVMPLIVAIANGPATLVGVDLAGVSIGQGPIQQLWNVNLHQARLEDVDMSYADLACSMNEAELNRVKLVGAELDRCLIRKARLLNCDFEDAKLIVNLDDSVCDGCSFVRASFLGGKAGAEYGGRRVKFVRCDFTGGVFKGIEFRATQFVECKFEETRFVQCDFRGARAEGGTLPLATQFEKMDVPDWAVKA